MLWISWIWTSPYFKIAVEKQPSVSVVEVHRGVSAQHHHWSPEGAERHRGSAAGSRRPQTLHRLTAPQHRHQETGSTVLETGGERELCRIIYSLHMSLFDQTVWLLTRFYRLMRLNLFNVSRIFRAQVHRCGTVMILEQYCPLSLWGHRLNV